jgi:hypothetical protein
MYWDLLYKKGVVLYKKKLCQHAVIIGLQTATLFIFNLLLLQLLIEHCDLSNVKASLGAIQPTGNK